MLRAGLRSMIYRRSPQFQPTNAADVDSPVYYKSTTHTVTLNAAHARKGTLINEEVRQVFWAVKEWIHTLFDKQ